MPMAVCKNIAFPVILQSGMNEREVAEKVEAMLRRVHLFDEITDAEVIPLDERTALLDGKACSKIEELFVELPENCMLLMVSHYQNRCSGLPTKCMKWLSGISACFIIEESCVIVCVRI